MPRKPLIKKLDLYGVVDYGSSDPASGVDGQLFYNTASNVLKVWFNSVWNTLSGGASGPGVGVDNWLLESGDNWLLESGDVLLLE